MQQQHEPKTTIYSNPPKSTWHRTDPGNHTHPDRSISRVHTHPTGRFHPSIHPLPDDAKPDHRSNVICQAKQRPGQWKTMRIGQATPLQMTQNKQRKRARSRQDETKSPPHQRFTLLWLRRLLPEHEMKGRGCPRVWVYDDTGAPRRNPSGFWMSHRRHGKGKAMLGRWAVTLGGMARNHRRRQPLRNTAHNISPVTRRTS